MTALVPWRLSLAPYIVRKAAAVVRSAIGLVETQWSFTMSQIRHRIVHIGTMQVIQ